MPATFPRPGPIGPAGQGVIFNVVEPSSNITVAHNLDRDVAATTYDPDGNEVTVGVTVRDSNTLILTTVPELPYSGKVVVI